MEAQRTAAEGNAKTGRIRPHKESAESERQPAQIAENRQAAFVAGGAGRLMPPSTPEDILRWQRAIGNQMVGQVLEATITRSAQDHRQGSGHDSETSVVVMQDLETPRPDDKVQSELNPSAVEAEQTPAPDPNLRRSESEQTSISDSSSRPRWSFDSVSGGPRWGASTPFQAIASPQVVSWAAKEQATEARGEGRVFEVITAPTTKDLADIQAVGTPNPSRLGVTTPPTAFVAPDFAFNTTKTAVAGGAFEWNAAPTQTAAAYEGDNICWVPAAGIHPTTLVAVPPGGGAPLPVFLKLSNAIAARNRSAELEHSKDIKHAFKISLKEAQKILTKHIIGKTLGPKATEAEAEQLVLDTIQRELVHPQLGNDKTQWGPKYETLFNLTAERDTKDWHRFGTGAATVTATKIVVKVTNGTTKINVVGSNALIKY